MLGIKHPDALCRPFSEVWSEAWHQVEPFVQQAMAGERVYFEDLPIVLRRKGFDEQT
jgi:hypothetical protein